MNFGSVSATFRSKPARETVICVPFNFHHPPGQSPLVPQEPAPAAFCPREARGPARLLGLVSAWQREVAPARGVSLGLCCLCHTRSPGPHGAAVGRAFAAGGLRQPCHPHAD